MRDEVSAVDFEQKYELLESNELDDLISDESCKLSSSYGAVNSETDRLIDQIDIADSSVHQTSAPQKADLISIIAIAFVVLVSDSARGILFPTLWLYVQSTGGTRVLQGFAVASYSAGRILSSPLFGEMSETHGEANTLILCNIIILIGCTVYAVTTNVYIIIAGQLIIGFGAGTLGVTRSYVAQSTDKASRSVYMAYLTAVQFAGFTVTPVLGSLLAYSMSQRSAISVLGVFEINQFTLPVLAIAGCCVICNLLLKFAFVGNPVKPRLAQEEKTARSITNPEPASAPAEEDRTWARWLCGDLTRLSDADKVAIGGLLLNVSTKGTIGVFETLGLEYVVTHFGWSSMKVGMIVSICGTVGVIFLLGFSCLLRYIEDIDLVLMGMAVMMISCAFLSVGVFFNTGGGVGSLFDQESEYFSSVVLMYAVGYPIGHTALVGVFSKIVKSGPQGKLLGWFGSAGSLARVVFPVVAGIVSQSIGDSYMFSALFLILLVTIVCYVVARPTIYQVITD